MRKLKSKALLTIALLLVGGFVLGGVVLSTAVGNVEFQLDGPLANLNWDPGAGWDNANLVASCYAMADYLDDDGNIIATLSVSGSRSPSGENHVSYSASASAYGANGSANAWVQVPGKGITHDQGGAGDDPVDWNDPNLPDGMSAWDSCVRNKHGVGLRSMSASAALSANGARVRVGFTASNI